MYHNVTDNIMSSHGLTIFKDYLEEQFQFLEKNNYKSFHFSELENLNQIPKKSIVITFDDVTLNQLDFAVPLLKKYVTKIVTFAELPEIWGVPAITISNGYYDPELQKIIDDMPDRLNEGPQNEFQMAMVAWFTVGHAPEILISSLIKYYSKAQTKNVLVHLIGKDGNLTNCRALVKKYSLEDKVIFHGEKPTREIVNILSKVHVCVGTLGLHRKNIVVDSSLKSREYAAMGMPMILRTRDLDMSPSLFFVKYFPEPESLLDINEIMKFYEELKVSHPGYKKEIQEFAKNNLSWSKKLEQVFEDIDMQEKI